MSAAEALPLLAGCAARALVLLAAARAGAWMLRRRSAALRHLVWSSALAAVLALPLLTRILPPLSVAIARPAALTARGPSRPAAASDVRSDGDGGRSNPARPSAGVVSGIGSSAAALTIWAALPWRQALVALWAAGVLAMLGRLAMHALALRSVARRAHEVRDAEWTDALAEARRRVGLGRPVRLLGGGGVPVPVTWGAWRAVVLLPAGSGAWTAERRCVVLAHELAHVRRLDAATLWMARLATALYWFLPPAWTAARRLADEAERACDDAVLRAGTLPSAYAAHLLEIARGLGRPVPAAALAMAGSRTEARLAAILDRGQPRGAAGRWVPAAVAAIAALCTLPLAALHASTAVAVREARTRGAAHPASHVRAGVEIRALDPGAARTARPRALVAGPREASAPAAVASLGRRVREAAAPSRVQPDTIPHLPASGPAARPFARDSARSFMSGSGSADSGTSIEVRRVVFSADGRVAAVRPGGWLELRETAAGRTRLLVGLPGVDGRPELTYRVNGVPAPVDDAVREWLAGQIRQLRL